MTTVAAPPAAPPRPAPLPPFASLVAAEGPTVYRFLVALAGAGAADDLFQETMVAALRAYPKLANGDHLRGWLLTIARRKAVDEARAAGRRPRPVAEVPAAAAPPPDAADATLWRDVRRLSERQRAAVALRFVADASHAEIAAALGCSEAAARQNVRAGLARLREWRTP